MNNDYIDLKISFEKFDKGVQKLSKEISDFIEATVKKNGYDPSFILPALEICNIASFERQIASMSRNQSDVMTKLIVEGLLKGQRMSMRSREEKLQDYEKALG